MLLLTRCCLLLSLFIWSLNAVGARENEANVREMLAEADALRAAIAAPPTGQSFQTGEALDNFTRFELSENKLGVVLDSTISRLGDQPNEEAEAQLLRHIQQQFDSLKKAVSDLRDHMQAMREQRASAEEASVEYEYRLGGLDELQSRLLRVLLDNLHRAGRLQIDVTAERDDFDALLEQRAALLSDQLRLAKARLKVLEDRNTGLVDTQEDAMSTKQAASEIALQRVARSLNSTVGLMRERGLDTTEAVQLLVTTTGEISRAVFDRRVLSGLLSDWLSVVRTALVKNGPAWFFSALLFIAIVLVFRALAKVVARIVRRMVSSSKMQFSVLLQDFFVTLASNAVFLIGILIALSQLGFDLGPVLAGLGVVGFIVGFALQETLSNFASGMMILIYRPFDVGDAVEAGGVSGRVSQMSLVSTTILTFDNQKLVVPNNKIWGDVIRNVNAEATRRVDLTFGISYADDIARAKAILVDILEQHELVLDEPEFNVRLHNLGESSVDFVVRPWVNSADYWTVYWDVTEAVKSRFDAEGISIPFPQRDVHVYQQTSND